MFGNSNITSSWANPQQNQQQQPTGTFGQPTGFGSSTFGSTSGFGQAQQQQPQANPMFGNLGGTPSTNTGTTGFGGFGGTSNTSQSGTGTSIFGAPKPATAFGGFNSGTGAFGQSSTPAAGSGISSGIFGQPSTTTTTSTFGGSSNIFGNKPTSPFGATNATTAVTTGSSNPPYAVFIEKDSTNNTNLQYQAISCMPAYSGTSFEELRLQDYAQGRKTSGTTFGQSAAFGTTPQTGTGVFGSQNTQQSAQPSAFGGTATNTGFGTFGNTNTTQSATAPAANSLFGGAGGFGSQPQPQQQQQPQGFTGFGSTTQPQQQSTSLFGNTFGGAAKPATGFSAFGSGGTGTSTFSGGAFGQNQQQQPQQQSTGLFGSQPATTGFSGFGNTSNAPKPSIFGTTQNTTQPAATGFNGFGTTPQQNQPQTQQNSLFGNTGGGGIFGNPAQPQQQQQQPAQPTTNPLFGGSTTQSAPGTGLFGGTNVGGGGGGGLFGGGANQQQQPQQQGQAGAFNMFGGNKPATTTNPLFTGGFGQNQQTASNAPQQGIFGNTFGQGTNQQSTLGGGIFGQKPAAPLLGSSTSTTGQNGFFGSSAPAGGLLNSATPAAQGTLTASISQPVGSLFDMLPAGPRLINLEASQPKKKSSFFVDIPTRSPVPRVQLGYTPANSKLRGFAGSTSASSSTTGNPFAKQLSFTSGKPGALSLNRMVDNKPANGGGGAAGDGFLGRSSSPALGSGARQSVKKVILDKKVEPSELFVKSTSPGLRGKVVFSPALSVATREKDALAAQASLSVNGTAELSTPTPSPRPARTPNRFTAQSQSALSITQSGEQGDQREAGELEEGDYWVKPDLNTLKQTGYDQLSSFSDLVVGRVGYGEIRFLEPVDLTGLPKLGALLGDVVRFDDKECSVYPDSEDVDKPPPGSGLNVRAKISLLHCWAVDKATREPIKDAAHAASTKHMKRLKNMKDTHFESFDMADGKWTFTVDHF